MTEHVPEILGNCDAQIVLGCSCGWREGRGTTWPEHMASPGVLAITFEDLDRAWDYEGYDASPESVWGHLEAFAEEALG